MKRCRALAALLSVALFLAESAGCGGGSATNPTDSGTPADAGGADAGQGDAGGADAEQAEALAECVSVDEPTYQPYSNDIPQVPLCADPDRVPLPTEGYLVDLTGIGPGDTGTCQPFVAFDETAYTIDATVGFPQVLRLPAVQGVDPGCAELCELEPTAFGLTVVYPGLIQDDRRLAVRVPAPWYLVIGNEHSPTPCLGGRPSVLEYGEPLACASTWGNHLGFATADPSAPSVDVVIDLLEPEEVPNTPTCCPYVCP